MRQHSAGANRPQLDANNLPCVHAVRGGREEVGQNVKMRGNANREEGGLGGLGDPARVAWLVLGNTQVLGTGYWETPGYGVLGTGNYPGTGTTNPARGKERSLQ